MRRTLRVASLVIIGTILAACTTIPTGPSVLVLPGTNKTFDQFRADDLQCRHFALEQIGGVPPGQAATQTGVAGAVVGAAIGTGVGAAIGGSRGAGVGAGTGLVLGSATGLGLGEATYYENQRRYDHAYQQCMYATGHRVPVSGRFTESPTVATPPPPPAGTPPPPPPGVVPRS